MAAIAIDEMKTSHFTQGLVAVGVVVVVVMLYRPVLRAMVMPAETRAAWVEPLATVGTEWAHVAEIPPLEQIPPVSRGKCEVVEQADAQKRKLLAVYRSGKGKYGVMRQFPTVEGKWISAWLLAEDGRLRYVRDRTHDDGGTPLDVETSEVKGVRVGFSSAWKFVEGEPTAKDSPILILELDVAGRSEPVKFY